MPVPVPTTTPSPAAIGLLDLLRAGPRLRRLVAVGGDATRRRIVIQYLASHAIGAAGPMPVVAMYSRYAHVLHPRPGVHRGPVVGSAGVARGVGLQ